MTLQQERKSIQLNSSVYNCILYPNVEQQMGIISHQTLSPYPLPTPAPRDLSLPRFQPARLLYPSDPHAVVSTPFQA